LSGVAIDGKTIIRVQKIVAKDFNFIFKMVINIKVRMIVDDYI